MKNKLTPFKWYVLNNFPFIEEDFDALTNYELMCKIIEYVNKIGAEVEELVNWFNNLDIQEEVDNKLDEMAEDGTLAEIINEEIFNELNTKVSNLETNSKTIPYYDMLSNGAIPDNSTPCDTIFADAKTSGYRKFYFRQNETNDAKYYFTNLPNFNDCEILADNGVQLNFPRLSTIDLTKDAIWKSNVTIYSRQQNTTFNVSKNESDYINQFSIPHYDIVKPSVIRFANTKMFRFNYSTGYYEDDDSNKSTYYQTSGYEIRFKARRDYSLICIPLDYTKKQCVEIVATPNTQIAYGWLNSTALTGIYARYQGEATGRYWWVNGTETPASQTDYSIIPNIFENHGRHIHSNNWDYHMKYKLKNNPDKSQIELYVNDVFCHSITYGTSEPNYIGFGIFNQDSATIDNGFSEILTYTQENTPFNCDLNILIAGDSRTYGYNSQYKIEEVITNGLANNGINNVNIDNISGSGYTLEQIYSALTEIDLSDYDIVVLCSGINNYSNTYSEILQKTYNIINLIVSNNCYAIVPATIPVGYGGTDALANERANAYYKIQQAVLSAGGYLSDKKLLRLIPNIMGNVALENNIKVTNDGVHPTTDGMILFAKSICKEIMNLF